MGDTSAEMNSSFEEYIDTRFEDGFDILRRAALRSLATNIIGDEDSVLGVVLNHNAAGSATASTPTGLGRLTQPLMKALGLLPASSRAIANVMVIGSPHTVCLPIPATYGQSLQDKKWISWYPQFHYSPLEFPLIPGSFVRCKFNKGTYQSGVITRAEEAATPYTLGEQTFTPLSERPDWGTAAPMGARAHDEERNPGTPRVLKGASNVSWGSNPLLQQFLEALDTAAAERDIYLGSSSAFRGGYDQTRIMLNNYNSKGGRAYFIPLYGSKGHAVADIYDMDLSREAKIQKVVREVPWVSQSTHSRGVALDLRWGFTTTGKVPRSSALPPAQVTEVLLEALKNVSADVLVESDHYHIVVKSSGASTVKYYRKAGTAQRTAAAAAGLTEGAVAQEPIVVAGGDLETVTSEPEV